MTAFKPHPCCVRHDKMPWSILRGEVGLGEALGKKPCLVKGIWETLLTHPLLEGRRAGCHSKGTERKNRPAVGKGNEFGSTKCFAHLCHESCLPTTVISIPWMVFCVAHLGLQLCGREGCKEHCCTCLEYAQATASELRGTQVGDCPGCKRSRRFREVPAAEESQRQGCN